MKNAGKIFEDDFKKSVPENVLYYRLHDPPQSFNQQKSKQIGIKFSWNNPCDCFLYDGETGLFYALELKSSAYKSFSYELIKNTKKTANIHYHQIESLTDFSKYKGVISGFLFNFRCEEKGTEITFFQSIENFNKMTKDLKKNSFNAIDLLKYHPIKIDQTKKKVHYTYDVKKMLKDINNVYV